MLFSNSHSEHQYAVLFDELHGLVRGRRCVIYNRAKYIFVRKQGDHSIWQCAVESLNRKCRSFLTTTLERRVIGCTQHSFSLCHPFTTLIPPTPGIRTLSPLTPKPRYGNYITISCFFSFHKAVKLSIPPILHNFDKMWLYNMYIFM